MHRTRGDRRDQRPDRNHVLRDWMVEHQAGMPVLMKPRRGHRRDAPDFGPRSTDHLAQLPITSGTTVLVAARARYRAEHRQPLAETRTTWIPRGPATWSEAPAVLAQGAPQTMAPLTEDARAHVVRARDGGVAHRWERLHAAPRQPQAPRPVDTQRLQPRAQAVNAVKNLCRPAVAGAADAPPALATVAPGLQATCLAQSPLRPPPRDDTRGRPGQGPPPDQVVYPRDGARAMRIAARQALIDQPSGFLRATHALDDPRCPPPEL